jgi:hypothetical protein
MFCSNCSEKILEYNNFCSKCGNPIKTKYKNLKTEIETNLDFDELNTQFWKNHEKLKGLKNGTPEYTRLYNENDKILDQIHIINRR